MEMIGRQVISPFVTFILDILSGLVVAWATVALRREPPAVPGGNAGHSFLFKILSPKVSLWIFLPSRRSLVVPLK